MARWTDEPVEDNDLHSYDLVRTPENRPLHAIVCSRKMVWTYLHFWKKRTLPCVEAPGSNPPQNVDEYCPACKAGRQARQTGFAFCFHERTNRIFIYEITKRAFDPFDAYFTNHGTLRGCRFAAERPSKKANGAVHITTDNGNYDSSLLPNPDELIAHLENMWEVKPSRPTPFGESKHDETLLAKGNGQPDPRVATVPR